MLSVDYVSIMLLRYYTILTSSGYATRRLWSYGVLSYKLTWYIPIQILQPYVISIRLGAIILSPMAKTNARSK